MSGTTARQLAREAVTRVRERSAYAHETVSTLLLAADLDRRDAAFASRLAFGTIACRGTLDQAVALHLSRPEGTEPRVLDCLAASAYELLFMRTPTRAAVSEGVELVKSVQPRAAGLANAVLRRVAERAADFPWGDPDTDLDALARLHGHPEWLARLLVEELGRDTASAVMAANNEPAPLFLSLLPFRGPEDDVLAELAADGADPAATPLASCVIAGQPGAAVTSRAVTTGRALVADAGAQLASVCVPVAHGSRIVELGAGRGTKSLLMAAGAARKGMSAEITAVDLHGFKLQKLSEAVERTGAPRIHTVVADATDPSADGLPGAGTADAVLVDAPCSGLGTLRRHPDRRWRARPDEIETLAELGARLLETAAVLVKPGGFVVYSTCTIARRENEDVADGFLGSREGSSFRVDDLSAQVPEEWRRFVDGLGRFRSLPEPGGPDGHFIARFIRSE